MQPSVVQAAKLAADMDDDEGDEAVDVSEAAGPGRAKKTKWLSPRRTLIHAEVDRRHQL